MGYGPVINGKQKPICTWQGSWAQEQQARRENPAPKPLTHTLQWPLGTRPMPSKR